MLYPAILLIVFGFDLWATLVFLISIWALVDIIRSSFSSTTTKILWIVLVILLPLLGSVIYFIFGREQRISKR